MGKLSIKISNRQAKSIALIVFLFFITPIFAQIKGKNLVPNSSFEEYRGTRPRQEIRSARPWVNVGTVDWFNKTDSHDTAFVNGPRTGDCYAGLRFQNKYKEFAYVKLLDGRLKKGQTYYFSMHVRLSPISTVAVKQLGVYFSYRRMTQSQAVFKEDAIIDSTYAEGLTGNLGWIPISGKYTANGKEQYLCIGNFSDNQMVKLKGAGGLFKLKEAYYYIDDIVLLDTSYRPPVEVPGEPVQEDSLITFEESEVYSMYFENGSAEMEANSQMVVDQLIELVGSNSTIALEISGHTDNIGNSKKNIELSYQRAEEVKKYLVEQGMTNEITTKGYGDSNPISTNDTEEGRYLNRRVDIKIIKAFE